MTERCPLCGTAFPPGTLAPLPGTHPLYKWPLEAGPCPWCGVKKSPGGIILPAPPPAYFQLSALHKLVPATPPTDFVVYNPPGDWTQAEIDAFNDKAFGPKPPEWTYSVTFGVGKVPRPPLHLTCSSCKAEFEPDERAQFEVLADDGFVLCPACRPQPRIQR